MAAVAHNPTFARKVGIPQSVGKDFSEADKGKKFNKGGEMKESKAMADAEMKALKRGHAPKRVLEHEKSEHKEMGYKHGGKIETKKVGFGMKDGEKGGRKPPHASKAAHDGEMPRKGFGMKHGGHVKPRSKHMAGGGMGAMPPRGVPLRRGPPRRGPAVNPAALAAMAGPPGGQAGPMGPGPGGMPGMKKGGGVHVHHSHHHHYAAGGMTAMEGKEFMKDRPGSEKIIRGPRTGSGPHGDEGAKRGHTKGKVVKMAHGGHVGSHPSRRGDGIAQKGHTKFKVC